MSEWWVLQAISTENQNYYIWNHARYEGNGYNCKDGRMRCKCTVKGCNAAIYVKDGLLRGVRDDDDWNNRQHSKHPHRDWNAASIVREDAIKAINATIKCGADIRIAFEDHLLSYPQHAANLPLSKMRHRLFRNVRDYPEDSKSKESVSSDIMNDSKTGWNLNYYGQLNMEFEQKMQDDAMDIDFKKQLLNSTSSELQEMINKDISNNQYFKSKDKNNGIKSDCVKFKGNGFILFFRFKC